LKRKQKKEKQQIKKLQHKITKEIEEAVSNKKEDLNPETNSKITETNEEEEENDVENPNQDEPKKKRRKKRK
jgi:hypothetical protein